jgi:hypothetical protein
MRHAAIRFLPLVALGACAVPGERAATGECPAYEVCSDDTPTGLYFSGSSLAGGGGGGVALTAIGGTQRITVQTLDTSGGNYVYAPLTLPYVADDDGGLGVKVIGQTGATVSVQGVAAQDNYLRILSPDTGELYDRVLISGAAIDDVALVGAVAESMPPDVQEVWATGDQRVGIALLAGDERVVDTSMALDAPGADRIAWDTLHFAAAQVGTTTITVTAADAVTRELALEIVDHVDVIAPIDNGTDNSIVEADSGALVCFAATNANRFVHGLAWTFTIDGVAVDPNAAPLGVQNCVIIDASDRQPSDTIAVTASAGGVTATLDVQVVAAAARAAASPKRPRPSRETAGERAAVLPSSR